MGLYVILALGFILLLLLGGQSEPEPPQVIYIVAQEHQGASILSALLGLAILLALTAYLFNGLAT